MDDTRTRAPLGPQALTLTDTLGNPLEDIEPPAPGSILLVGGIHGVAWQRHFNGGRWHSTTGGTRSFTSLMTQRNVVLVYNAPVRD